MHRSHSFETIESCSLDSVNLANLRETGELNTVAWNNTTTTDNMNGNNTSAEGVVSDTEEEEENNHNGNSMNETGILIVAPTEEEMQRSTLTIPDSIPSNVGSLRLSAMNHPHRPSRTNSNGSVSSASAQQQQQQQKSNWMTRLSIAMALVVFLLMCISPALYMMWERQELRSTTSRLEEEIRALNQKIETNKMEQQRQQQQQQHNNNNKARDSHQQQAPPPKFPWQDEQTCSGSSSSSRIDNCWVHAQANFELGDCARKTKTKVTKGLHKLGRNLWHAQAEVLRTVKEHYTETADLFKEARKNATAADEGGEEHDPSPAIAKTKERMKNLGKTATKVLSGVAFASAAALVVSAAFVFGGDEEDD